MKQKCYRHGEICFLQIKSLPKGLKETKTNLIERGSHGHDHTLTGGKLYLLPELQDYTMGYLKADGTKLYHPEHSPKGCKLPNGIYEIRKQKEFTPEGLIPVVD